MALAMKAAKSKAMKAPAKPAMKGMKAMKAAMKAMKKLKKVSVVAKGKYARAAVFKGKKAKTSGGLTKNTLVKSKSGKIVSRSRSARAKAAFASSALKKWCDALKKARKELGIVGFCAAFASSALKKWCDALKK